MSPGEPHQLTSHRLEHVIMEQPRTTPLAARTATTARRLPLLLATVFATALVGCTEGSELTGPVTTQTDSTTVTPPPPPPPPPTPSGFTGAWAVTNWSKSGITGGTTEVRGWAEELTMSYDVNLGVPGRGVPRRTATYQVVAPATGTVRFDWEYTGFHAYFRAFATLRVLSGSSTNVLVNNASAGGHSFTFRGSSSIAVAQGQPLRFEVGGENYDSNSRLRGSLRITGFRFIE